MAIKKVKVESRDDIATGVAAAKKGKKKTFKKLKEEMAEREQKSTVAKSTDLLELDLSKMPDGERHKKIAQLQVDKLLRGWNSKTKQALILTDEFAKKQAARRAENEKKKEELDQE